MSGGGGDGGAKEARKQEEERQRRINMAVGAINTMFDGGDYTYFDDAAYLAANPDVADKKKWAGSALDHWKMYGQKEGRADPSQTISADPNARAKLYADQKQSVFDLNKRDVDRQYKDAERANRFGLARAGLMGGSVDVDANADIQERTNEGLMRATGIADAAAADLKTQDERARQSLISMAQSGIDTGTAQTMAMRQLDATAQAANGARQGATIGGLFDDMSQAYLMRQVGQGMRAGQNPNQQWYGVSSPQQTYAGSVS